MSDRDNLSDSADETLSPILQVAKMTGQSYEDMARHWADLFIQHDRLMLTAFVQWAGPERAIQMHNAVWENPHQPLLEIFFSVGATAQEALEAYARAFMIHDYYSLRVMREELGDVQAIEAHHSLWEGQSADFALTPGHIKPEGTGEMSWDELFDLYKSHADREGLPYALVENSEDSLVINTKTCAYFDTIAAEFGREGAEEHNHLIAIESTDRTIEGFLGGINQENQIRGVMTKHRCHGDDVCQIEFTRRDPLEPLKLNEPLSRVGTRCFFCD